MIHFVLGLSPKNGVSFGSSPHKPEWERLTWIFTSGIKLSFFELLNSQLTEAMRGKRKKFVFDEEKDYEDSIPVEFCDLKLYIIDRQYIDIHDCENNNKLIVKTAELKAIVENWLKFVDVNTKAFAK